MEPLPSVSSTLAQPAVLQDDAFRAETPPNRLSFFGIGGTLFGIHIVNVLLTLLTLGVYRFWGKVRTRRYLWSQMEFAGDRFAYHGTGRELLIGFLRALIAFGVPIGLTQILELTFPVGEIGSIFISLVVYLLFLIFAAVAVVGARRYRLSRTSWRGIRFSFRGRTIDYVKLLIKGTFLNLLTFGLYLPIDTIRRQQFLLSHSYIGNKAFQFDGQERELFRIFLFTLVFPALVVFTLALMTLLLLLSSGTTSVVISLVVLLIGVGVCFLVYSVKKQRYLWNHTYFATARFSSTLAVGPFLSLHLSNMLLLIVTLGFAWPWTVVRKMHFLTTYLSVEGPLKFSTIQQEAHGSSAMSEGLAGILDADVDIGS
jgi:uncharacterized membrane protein YjgN (DUF898 family)